MISEKTLTEITNEDLERTKGMVQKCEIEIRTLMYLTSDVDELLSAKKFHKERIKTNITEKIRYGDGFKDYAGFILKHKEDEFLTGCSTAVSIYRVRCYSIEEGAYCNFPKETLPKKLEPNQLQMEL